MTDWWGLSAQTPGFEDVPPWFRLLVLGVVIGAGVAMWFVGRRAGRNGPKVIDLEKRLDERWATAEAAREKLRAGVTRLEDAVFGRQGRSGIETELQEVLDKMEVIGSKLGSQLGVTTGRLEADIKEWRKEIARDLTRVQDRLSLVEHVLRVRQESRTRTGEGEG
jgi:hypothetical protein